MDFNRYILDPQSLVLKGRILKERMLPAYSKCLPRSVLNDRWRYFLP